MFNVWNMISELRPCTVDDLSSKQFKITKMTFQLEDSDAQQNYWKWSESRWRIYSDNVRELQLFLDAKQFRTFTNMAATQWVIDLGKSIL